MEAPLQTTIIRPPQEVGLRTLASDIASLEHGNQQPAAQQLVAPTITNITTPNRSGGASSHHGRLWLGIIFTIVLLSFLYFVVYPRLTSSTIISQ